MDHLCHEQYNDSIDEQETDSIKEQKGHYHNTIPHIQEIADYLRGPSIWSARRRPCVHVLSSGKHDTLSRPQAGQLQQGNYTAGSNIWLLY
jgi:hypothetical protein